MTRCRSTFLHTPCQLPAGHTGDHQSDHPANYRVLWDDKAADPPPPTRRLNQTDQDHPAHCCLCYALSGVMTPATWQTEEWLCACDEHLPTLQAYGIKAVTRSRKNPV